MEVYRIAKRNIWNVDIEKMASKGYKAITVIGKNIELTIPINFFTEAEENALEESMPYNSIEALFDRCEQVYGIQADFSNFDTSSHKVSLIFEEGITGHSRMSRIPPTIFLQTPTPKKLLDLIRVEKKTDGDLISALSHEMGHVFEFLGHEGYVPPAYMRGFEEVWTNVLAVYTCEKLKVPLHTLNWGRVSDEEKQEFSRTGSYESLKKFSDYGYAMLKDIKDFGGWDVFRNLFHELVKNPLPEGETDEARWLALRNIILEKSNVDIAPILFKYHVPLPQEIHDSFSKESDRDYGVAEKKSVFKRSLEDPGSEKTHSLKEKYNKILNIYNKGYALLEAEESSDPAISDRIKSFFYEAQEAMRAIDPDIKPYPFSESMTPSFVMSSMYSTMEKAYQDVLMDIRKEPGDLVVSQKTENSIINLRKEDLATIDLRKIFCSSDTEFVQIRSDKLILTIPRIFFKEDAIWRLSYEEMQATQLPEDRIFFRDRSSNSDDLISVFNTCEEIYGNKSNPFSISFVQEKDAFSQYLPIMEGEGIIVVPEPAAIVEYLRDLESDQNSVEEEEMPFHASESFTAGEDDAVVFESTVLVRSSRSISNSGQSSYSSMNTLSPREKYMKIDSFYREVSNLIEEEQKLPWRTEEINMKTKDAFQRCKQLVYAMDPSKNTFLSEENLTLSSILDALYPFMEDAYTLARKAEQSPNGEADFSQKHEQYDAAREVSDHEIGFEDSNYIFDASPFVGSGDSEYFI